MFKKFKNWLNWVCKRGWVCTLYVNDTAGYAEHWENIKTGEIKRYGGKHESNSEATRLDG